MEDERIVPALLSVYKAEVWRHLGFCGNVRPGTVAQAPSLAAPRVKSLHVGYGGRQGRCAAAAFSRVGGTVAKSTYYTRLWASFFVKLREKNPWSRDAVFWAYFTKYGCLLGKSDKRLCFFIYVRQCIDWHSVCSQLIASQCNNISRRVICQMFRPSLEKNHIQKEGAWCCNPSDDRSRRRGAGWLSFSLIFTMFCNVLIITSCNKKHVVIS